MAEEERNMSLSPDTTDENLSQDYYALRSLGIKLISNLGTDHWTDFNAHDPGITILETVTYAITDLGYRADFPIEDLLAQPGLTQAEMAQQEFHTAASILPTSPVTLTDFRKILIDQEGIDNAWITPVNHFQPFKGLRSVVLQLADPNMLEDDLKHLKHHIRKKFWENRNLGEALDSIDCLQPRKLALDLEIVVDKGFVPEEILAKAIVAIQNFLIGKVQFLTLAQMYDACAGDSAKVFEGPVLKHGFFPDKNLKDKKTKVDPDQLIRCIRNIPGLESVVKIGILTRVEDKVASSPVQPVGGDGVLYLGDNETPVLDDLSVFTFVVQQSRRIYPVDLTELEQEVQHQAALQPVQKQAITDKDLPIPLGKYRNLEHYYSIQYDFPSIYNLRSDPATEPPNSPHQGERNQLRAYLLLFDQVMANYLSQLAHVFELFSWDKQVKSTYFFQGLEYALQGMMQLLAGTPGSAPTTPEGKKELMEGLAFFKSQLAGLRESRQEFLGRRSRFLNHLLARFGRSLDEYVSQLPTGDRETKPAIYNSAAESILANYPALSSRRGTGSNPLLHSAPEEKKPGIQHLVESIFALPAQTAKTAKSYDSFTILDNTSLITQRVFRQQVLTTDDGTPINLAVLIAYAVEEKHYQIVETEEDPDTFTIWLYGDQQTDQPGGLYKFVNSYPSVDAAIEAIHQTVKMFREFSKASEKLYFIDHILLRPFNENPVFGLRIQGKNQKLLLLTTGWYPMEAIEMAGQISADNSETVYGDDAGTGKPFTFRIRATQNGKPYPIFPPAGYPLPATFETKSSTVELPELIGKINDYFQQFYSKNTLDGVAIGNQITADFIAPLLPLDWVPAGKSTLMESWGKKALADILTRWEANPSPDSTLEDAITQAMANIPAPTPTPLPQSDRLLLAGYAKAFYRVKFPNSTDLVNALKQDLGENNTPSAAFSVDASAYLSTVGRALGKAWFTYYFPSVVSKPELLGDTLLTTFCLQNPTGLDKILENSIANSLMAMYNGQNPPITGMAFLEAFLKSAAVSSSTSNNFQKYYPTAAINLLATLIQNAWVYIDGSGTEIAGILTIWRDIRNTIPADANLTTLSAFSLNFLSQYWDEIVQKAQGDLTTIAQILETQILQPAQNTPSTDPLLLKIGQNTLLWYVRNILAINDPFGGDEDATKLLSTLGVFPQKRDLSMLETGKTVLEFYCNNIFSGKTPAPEDLGKSLIDALLPTTGTSKTDFKYIFATIGAFTLSNYYQSQIAPAITKKKDGSILIAEKYATKAELPIDPKKDTSKDFSSGAKALVTANQAKIKTIIAANESSSGGNLNALVNDLNLAQFLITQTGGTVSASKIETQITLLQTPALVATLPDTTVSALATAGKFFTTTLIQSVWPWQNADPESLGKTIQVVLPKSQSAVLQPLAEPVAQPTTAAPVNYFFKLEYTTADGIPVEMATPKSFESQTDITDEINWLTSSIPTIETGKIPFNSIFNTILLPENPGIDPIRKWEHYQEPYSSRLTVIGPDWPIRFQERGFKDQLEQAIAEESPAHILTNFLWLTKQELQVFEDWYDKWISEGLNDIARDLYSRKIAQFILSKSAPPIHSINPPDSENGGPTT